MNLIIILALAVLVLVAILTFFSSQFFSGSGQVDVQKVFGAGCSALRFNYGCEHSKVNDVSIDGTSLGYACGQKGLIDTVQCAKACGCSVPDSEAGQALSSSRQSSSGASQGSSSGRSSQTQSQQAENAEPKIEFIGFNLIE